MKKTPKIILSIVCAVVIALGAFLIVWFCGKNYKDFYASATEQFEVPALDEGLAPQGMHYDSTNNVFLVSGYMKDGSASRIYKVTDSSTSYFTLSIDEEDYVGHCGGVATHGDLGYIVGEHKVYVFSLTEAMDAENGEAVVCETVLDAPNGADFITVNENQLYIGEFYHETKYPTKEEHHITSADGVNPALTFAYDLNGSTQYGFDITSPSFVISTTEKIQGMAITDDGYVVLSQSWSLSDSHLLIYKALADITTSKYNYNGSEIDAYVLDSSNLKTDLVLPSMSEELTMSNGKVYVCFENACQKYKLVTRHKNTKAYSIDVDAMLEENN